MYGMENQHTMNLGCRYALKGPKRWSQGLNNPSASSEPYSRFIAKGKHKKSFLGTLFSVFSGSSKTTLFSPNASGVCAVQMSAHLPLNSRRCLIIFRENIGQLMLISAQSLKQAKQMSRAPESDQMEDLGM